MKTLSSNAGDTGSIPDLERSHMPRSSEIHVPQLLSQCSRVQELQLPSLCALEPVFHNKRDHHNEKPARHNERVALLIATRERLALQQQRPSTTINK